jgi:hypothetical protein
MSSIFPHSEAHSPDAALSEPSSLGVEVNLQQALDTYATSATDMSTTSKDAFSYADNAPIVNGGLRDMSALGLTLQFPALAESMHGAIHRVKYHMYEVTTYWPALYRIILNGSADPELLPYAPLFFESVSSFLCAGTVALALCRPKAWFLCARSVPTSLFPETEPSAHMASSVYTQY